MRVAATYEISQYGLKIFFYSFFDKIAQLLQYIESESLWLSKFIRNGLCSLYNVFN